MTTDAAQPEVVRLLARLWRVALHADRQAVRVQALSVIGRILGLWTATPEEDAADRRFVRRLLSE